MRNTEIRGLVARLISRDYTVLVPHGLVHHYRH